MTALRSLLNKITARGAPALPIGVDFAGASLNLMQVEKTPHGVVVRAAASLPYPVERTELMADGRRLRAFVNAALASAPFTGRKVVAALAPADVRILPLSVTVPAGQSEQQAVARAVRDQLGTSATDAVVDYYQVRSPDAAGAEKQMLAAVASTPVVLAYLEALRGAGFDPVALDIGPAAIARLLAAMHRDDHSQSILLINFGLHRSYLTVIWGRRLMLDREIEFGEVQLVDKLAATLGLDPATALALLREHGTGEAVSGGPDQLSAVRDIGRTIREILHPEFAALAEELVRTQVYVASRTRGSSVSRVYLNGSVARYAHIRPRIEELIHLPVQVLDPFAAFEASPEVARGAEPMHGIALAAGLALRGVDNG
jgi:type IV pilus assembly protein PilM